MERFPRRTSSSAATAGLPSSRASAALLQDQAHALEWTVPAGLPHAVAAEVARTPQTRPHPVALSAGPRILGLTSLLAALVMVMMLVERAGHPRGSPEGLPVTGPPAVAVQEASPEPLALAVYASLERPLVAELERIGRDASRGANAFFARLAGPLGRLGQPPDDS